MKKMGLGLKIRMVISKFQNIENIELKRINLFKKKTIQ